MTAFLRLLGPPTHVSFTENPPRRPSRGGPAGRLGALAGWLYQTCRDIFTPASAHVSSGVASGTSGGLYGLVHVHSWMAAGASYLQTHGGGCLLCGLWDTEDAICSPVPGEQSLAALQEGPASNDKFFCEREPTELPDPGLHNERGDSSPSTAAFAKWERRL